MLPIKKVPARKPSLCHHARAGGVNLPPSRLICGQLVERARKRTRRCWQPQKVCRRWVRHGRLVAARTRCVHVHVTVTAQERVGLRERREVKGASLK